MLSGRASRRLLLVAALCAITTVTAARAVDVPHLTGRVVDTAELLAPADETRISERLASLERETGAQVVVLTVPTLDGNPVEDYAIKVAETWKLGRKGVDDGVVFLIAREERALRLEVGYGLEAKLPDILSKRILDELVVPRLREGDIAGGVEAGIDAVEKTIRGGDPLPPPKRGTGAFAPLGSPGRLVMGIVFLLFTIPFALSALYSSGAASWLVYAILTPFFAAFPIATFGLPGIAVPLLWLIGFPILRHRIQRSSARLGDGGRPVARRQPTRRGSGWWGSGGMGGFGGGGFGGGGFSGGGFGGGGGFSGGGGSFGGGGASSRW